MSAKLSSVVHLEPPDWLTDEAKTVFRQTAEALGPQGLPTDSSILAEFAQAQADCEAWTIETRFCGEVLVSDKGNHYTNPLYTNLQARRKDLERYRDDLGMTPKARGVAIKGTPKAGLMDRMKR